MIRRVLAFVLLGFLLTAIESAVLAATSIELLGIHLVLGLVLYLAINGSGLDGAFAVLMVGYTWDAFAGTPMGLSAFLCGLLFVVVRVSSGVLDLSGPMLLVLGGVCEAIHGLGAITLLALGGRLGTADLGAVFGTLGLQIPLAALFVPLVFSLCGVLDRLMAPRTDGRGEVWLE